MATHRTHTLAGVGVLAAGALMAWGASGIPSDAGYAGVGPNFLPWVVSVALVVCGLLLTLQGLRGGWVVDADAPSSTDGAGHPGESGNSAISANWSALAWMAAGVALNAALITRLGFILSCALCFVLAVRGLRLAEGRAAAGLGAAAQAGRYLLIGAAIAAPVFWIFTKLLNIGLPGLTTSGWL